MPVSSKTASTPECAAVINGINYTCAVLVTVKMSVGGKNLLQLKHFASNMLS